MPNLLTNNRSKIILLPVFGICLFVTLYIVATFYYPGGSQVDIHSKGFSWKNNYWCNLLNDNAIDGEVNPAKPIAITAMIVLCLSLSNFWYVFPPYLGFNKMSRLIIQTSGIISMFVALFLFTRFHDVVINVASVFSFIALIGTFIGINKLKWNLLFAMGIFNLILIAINNILYYGDGLRLYLPFVQKITFLTFLIWICLLNYKIFKSKINH